MAVVEVHSLLVVENCTEQEVYARVEVEDIKANMGSRYNILYRWWYKSSR